MTEPISGVQNQTIILRVSHESSHLVSLQQYSAQAAMVNSAQNLVKRTEREMNAPKNVNQTEGKRTQSSTEGKSQGEYTAQGGTQKKEEKGKVSQDNSHILDVRV